MKDFKSIKLSPEKRKYIDAARNDFERYGDIPSTVKSKILKMRKNYSRQFDELYAARERARRTNWRRREGITDAQARKLVEDKRAKVEEKRADLGI